jgi:hypothetical protein
MDYVFIDIDGTITDNILKENILKKNLYVIILFLEL